jgi:hypothetical protein
MTSRFVWVVLIAISATMLFPNAAFAQTQNTRLVFEINSFQKITIPEDGLSVRDIAQSMSGDKPAPVIVEPVVIEQPKPKNYIPPKVAPENRVYMHEPEIRAYVCPKLGDKCNIFIAVLKAENGTHECTRDNRGLNRNGSVDIGLAQINWRPGNPYHTFEQLQDCKYNLDVALEMYSRRGFQPWYAYTKGAYKRHLPAVLASAKAIELAAVTEVVPNPEQTN